VECREVWLVNSRALGPYLEQELDWPGVQLSGRVRRSRRPLDQTAWESQETYIWVSSLAIEHVTPRTINQLLRGYWAVENGLFRVRDVSYDEDRLHGRLIGPGLSSLRNIAISTIRRQAYRYIPDGWRDIASQRDAGLHLLQRKRLIL
jgi:hypothetical protein